MQWLSPQFAILIGISLIAPVQESIAQTTPAPSAGRVVSANDNTRPAGRLEGNVLTVRLYAGVGSARPAGPQSAPIEVAAFGEEGADLSAPGPLIRVREGTTIVLTLRNALASTLRVEGLCARPGPCNPVSVAPGASQEIRFDLDAPGTYFYWATTSPGPLRARRGRDTQIGGAIVVPTGDGAEAFVDAQDIAAVASATLADPQAHAGTQYALTGREALTLTEAAKIISEVTGQTINHLDIDRDEWVAGAVAGGVPAEYGVVLRMLTETIASGRGSRPSNDVEKVTGTAPIRFADFARRTAAAWALDKAR